MSCEHGLTTKECYVCMSPKYGKQIENPKGYKITGKLGDICSFVGGNEVKKGDMVYLHSKSDMKQERVAKPQGEEHMSIEAMKQALEALELGLEYAKGEQFENAQRFKGYEHLAPNDSDSVKLIEDAITSLRQAIEKAEKQEPVALQMDVIVVNLVREGINKHRARELAEHFIKHTTPQQREWVGLTTTDWNAIAYTREFRAGAEWAERLMREKNGG